MMPLPFSNPLLSAGAGSSIPISAAGGTAGPATSGLAGGINIGGLFGSNARSNSDSFLMPLIIGGAILVGVLLLRKR